MESKEIQTAVKNKYENGDGPTKIFRDLGGGVVSLQTIKLWIKMIRETGSINFAYSPGRPRAIRTKSNILKEKQRMAQKKKCSANIT
jgi:transposase